jgi:hypothetical protein
LGSAAHVDERDGGNATYCQGEAANSIVAAAGAGGQGGEIERIASDTALYPTCWPLRRQNTETGHHLAQTIGLHDGRLAMQADKPAQASRRNEFGESEPDGKPTQGSGERVSRDSMSLVHGQTLMIAYEVNPTSELMVPIIGGIPPVDQLKAGY